MSDNRLWFYLDGNDRKGPFTHDTLIQLQTAGVISPDGWIAREGDADWSPARVLQHPFANATAEAPAVHDVAKDERLARLKDLLGDWRMLPWAALLVVAVFVGQLLLSFYMFQWTNLHPAEKVFAWPRVTAGLARLAGLMLLPPLGICWLQRYRSRCRGAERGVPARSRLPLIGYWLGIVMFCWWIESGSIAASGLQRLTTAYMASGCGGWILLLAAAVGVGVIGASTWVSERIRRGQIPKKTAGEAVPVLPLIAAGWSTISAVLILTAFMDAGAFAVFMWPAQKNTDGRTATQIIRAIESYQQKHGGMLAKTWNTLPPPQQPDEPFVPLVGYGMQTSHGDVEGTSDGLLLKLLNHEAEEGTILGPRGNPPAEIRDMWGRLFHVVLDANGDGEVKVGGKTYAAKAAVWSCGWNGREDSGGWDDVVRVWKQ